MQEQAKQIIGAYFPNTAQLLTDLSVAKTDDAAMGLFMRRGQASVTEVVLVLRTMTVAACCSGEHEAAEDGRSLLAAWESLGDLMAVTVRLEKQYGCKSDAWSSIFQTYQKAAETMVTGLMRGFHSYAPSDN